MTAETAVLAAGMRVVAELNSNKRDANGGNKNQTLCQRQQQSNSSIGDGAPKLSGTAEC